MKTIILLFVLFCANLQAFTLKIVGAGPIGLISAIKAKILFEQKKENLEIIFFEKREERGRENILQIDWNSLVSKNEVILKHPLYQQLLLILKEYKVGKKDKLRIKTNELELILKDLLVPFATFYYEEIHEENVMRFLQNRNDSGNSAILATDGAHSFMRKHFFATEEYPEGLESEHIFQYLALLRYTIKGKMKDEHPIHNFVKQVDLSQDYLFNLQEIHGHYDEETQTTPMSIFINIDAPTYQELDRNYSFKSPYIWSENPENIPVKLYTSAKVWIDDLSYYNQELFQDTAKINGVKISYYKAPHVYQFSQELNSPLFLAGDSALGLPWMRSLNAGLLVTDNLSENLLKYSLNTFDPKEYSTFFQTMAKMEIDKAIARAQKVKKEIKFVKNYSALCNFPPINLMRKEGAKVLAKTTGKSTLAKKTAGTIVWLINPKFYNEFYQ